VQGGSVRLLTADEDGLRGEQRPERAQAVGPEGVAARDEIDDGVREAEPRRNLDRAGHVDELGSDPALDEQLARKTRKDRGNPEPGELVERRRRRFLRHRRFERAAAEAEPQQLRDLRTALPDEIRPGDAAVDDTVLNVLRNVRGTDEEDLDRRVPTGERERPLPRFLGTESSVLEQRHRRLAEASLRRDGDPQPVERLFARSSANR
jgi:hypothetical protein